MEEGEGDVMFKGEVTMGCCWVEVTGNETASQEFQPMGQGMRCMSHASKQEVNKQTTELSNDSYVQKIQAHLRHAGGGQVRTGNSVLDWCEGKLDEAGEFKQVSDQAR